MSEAGGFVESFRARGGRVGAHRDGAHQIFEKLLDEQEGDPQGRQKPRAEPESERGSRVLGKVLWAQRSGRPGRARFWGLPPADSQWGWCEGDRPAHEHRL